MTRRRRIMRRFRISELSAVDHPAQEFARAVILKGDERRKELEMQTRPHKTTRSEPRAFPSYEAAVRHLREVHNLSGCDAMAKARKEHPDAFAKYQREGEAMVAKAAEQAEKARGKPREVEAFELLIESIRERDGVSRRTAMERARKANPALFAAYRRA